MARDRTPRPSFAFPSIRATIKNGEGPFWDVKFYPYVVERDDPAIFAVSGLFSVHVCQLTDEEESGVRFLFTLRRDEHRNENVDTVNSCAWCYLEQDDPLLAVAGESGHVQIFRPFTGELVYTLTGHGIGVVNDIVTHPQYPWILASCSIDSSIRIWDLRRAGQKSLSSCVIICGHSLAHKEGIISINWHNTGFYLVSGGFDHKICVWTIPDLGPKSQFWHEISKEGRKRSREEVRVITYPHFVSSAIHGDFVDAVMFWDDFIISKACRENRVVLWRIAGFNSELPPPLPETAPKSLLHLETRNGFTRKLKTNIDDDVFEGRTSVGDPPFERLLEFSNKDSAAFYMRFGLLQPSRLFPELHTVLSVGDNFSRLKHWDLDRYITGDDDLSAQPGGAAPIRKKGMAVPAIKDSMPSSRSASSATFTPSLDGREASTGATSLASDQDRNEEGRLRVRYKLHDFEERLKPHMQNDGTKHLEAFTIRGVSWSPCGRWCVAVGEAPAPGRGRDVQGAISILERGKVRE